MSDKDQMYSHGKGNYPDVICVNKLDWAGGNATGVTAPGHCLNETMGTAWCYRKLTIILARQVGGVLGARVNGISSKQYMLNSFTIDFSFHIL